MDIFKGYDEGSCCIKNTLDSPYVDVRFILKQEAIKWVKELSGDEDEVMDKYRKIIFHDFEPTCEIGVVIGFIEHFFNITEEDLNG